MNKDSVVIIDPAGLLEKRTSKSGRSRHTVRIKAEPIAINTDPKTLGQGIADALALHYRNEIKSIAAPAASATIKARESAARNTDSRWVKRRYAGGRIGPMSPNQSRRAFNDSGRFAKSLVARATKSGSWIINVAANRLDDATSGGALRIWNRLKSLVPSIANIGLALKSNDVLRAAVKSVEASIVKGKAGSSGGDWAGAFAQAFDAASSLTDTSEPDPIEEEEIAG